MPGLPPPPTPPHVSTSWMRAGRWCAASRPTRRRARSLGQAAHSKATAGAQRLAWDATYTGADPQGQTIWGYTGGVKAPPGTYTARLAAGGETQSRTFRLFARPAPS